MSVCFLRESFEWASEIPRTIFVHPSGLLRGFFEAASRVLEGFPKRLRGFSKKPRRMCEGNTKDVRRNLEANPELTKGVLIRFYIECRMGRRFFMIIRIGADKNTC